MTNLADRLNALLKEKNLSQAAFARLLGIAQPSVYKIISGSTKNPGKILEMAAVLGVNPHWLKTGEGSREINNDSGMVQEAQAVYAVAREVDPEHCVRVDLLDFEAAAHSTGIVNLDYPDVILSIFFTPDGLMQMIGRRSADGIKIFRVPTDSLAPTINPNELVFVDTLINRYTTEGIYVFNLDGETYIKRLQRIPGGIYRALSDNINYPPFEIMEEQFCTAEIIGKFLAVLPFKLVGNRGYYPRLVRAVHSPKILKLHQQKKAVSRLFYLSSSTLSSHSTSQV